MSLRHELQVCLGMAAVDMELKKHFEELQAQMIESRAKIRQIDAQVEQLKRTSQHSGN